MGKGCSGPTIKQVRTFMLVSREMPENRYTCISTHLDAHVCNDLFSLVKDTPEMTNVKRENKHILKSWDR